MKRRKKRWRGDVGKGDIDWHPRAGSKKEWCNGVIRVGNRFREGWRVEEKSEEENRACEDQVDGESLLLRGEEERRRESQR